MAAALCAGGIRQPPSAFANLPAVLEDQVVDIAGMVAANRSQSKASSPVFSSVYAPTGRPLHRVHGVHPINFFGFFINHY
jgi:hypothetical protein